MLEDAQKLRRLSILSGNLYESCNVYIRQVNRRGLQWRQTRMTETVIVLERNYERSFSYMKEEVVEKLNRKDEIRVRAESSALYAE